MFNSISFYRNNSMVKSLLVAKKEMVEEDRDL
jgi:hypothetical protein